MRKKQYNTSAQCNLDWGESRYLNGERGASRQATRACLIIFPFDPIFNCNSTSKAAFLDLPSVLTTANFTSQRSLCNLPHQFHLTAGPT